MILKNKSPLIDTKVAPESINAVKYFGALETVSSFNLTDSTFVL